MAGVFIVATSKRHHYLSQFYLRGFTTNGCKNSKLIVFDLKKNRTYSTTSKNVAVEKGFNEINVIGVQSDELEHTLAGLESNAAKAFQEIIKSHVFDKQKHCELLLLIACYSMRNPWIRDLRKK